MYSYLYRKILLPLFEKGIKRRKMLDHLHLLEHSQYWPRDLLNAFQAKELARLLVHAYEQVPYYHDLFLRSQIDMKALSRMLTPACPGGTGREGASAPEDTAAMHAVVVSELKKLPILDKDIIRTQGEDLLAGNYKDATWAKGTGGSTGQPLQFHYTPESYDWRVAASKRGYHWAHCLDGMKQAYIWGVDNHDMSLCARWKRDLHFKIQRQKYFNCFVFREEHMAQALEELNRYKPEIIVGYTNPLYAFAQFIKANGGARFRPKACISAAEKLHEFQRNVISSVFDCEVFNTYGSREFMLIAAECAEHKGLHLSSENLFVEIVRDDDTPAPAGEAGDIVITDLHNYGMPFIRYRIGDQGIMSERECACGRNLPLLEEVVGRSLDMIRTPDGRVVPGEFFPHLMKDFSAIKQFQVVQEALDHVVIKIVPQAGFSDEDSVRLKTCIISVLGEEVRIDLTIVEDIPLTKTGKFRVTVSHL